MTTQRISPRTLGAAMKEKAVSKNAYIALATLKTSADWTTSSDVADSLEVSRRSAKNYVLELYNAGAVERRRYTRGFSYGYEYRYLSDEGIAPRTDAKTRVAKYLAKGEKQCSKCKATQPLELFPKRLTGSYESLCKRCRQANYLAWRARNKVSANAKAALRDKKRYAIKKDQINSRRRQSRENLDDYYVATLLFPGNQLSRLAASIPKPLIDAKKASVLIKRALKENRKTHAQTGN